MKTKIKNVANGAIFSCLSLLSAYGTHTYANNLLMDISDESVKLRGDATHSSTNMLYFASLHVTDDKGEAVSLGLLKVGQVGRNENLTGGIGAKAYVVDPDADTFYALALGGKLAYEVTEVEGLSVSSELFYAPDITISEDIEKLIDFHIRANYALFENGLVYGGVRSYKFEAENDSTYKFDTGPFVGVQISF